MHNAPAFEDDVAAYPAVIAVRRGAQGSALVASVGAEIGTLASGAGIADAITDVARREGNAAPGFSAILVDQWFRGTAPWPSLEPRQLRLLQRLEAEFGPLEDPLTGTRIGIGVATGADRVFITTEPDKVTSYTCPT